MTFKRRYARNVRSNEDNSDWGFLYLSDLPFQTPIHRGEFFERLGRSLPFTMIRASSPFYSMMPFRKPVHGLRRILFFLTLPAVFFLMRYYMPGRTEWVSQAVKTQAERLQGEGSTSGGL